MSRLFTYIRWCWIFKEIMPWEVSFVSFDGLTEEQYHWVDEIQSDLFKEFFIDQIKS